MEFKKRSSIRKYLRPISKIYHKVKRYHRKIISRPKRSYEFLSRYLGLKDYLFQIFHPALRPLHQKLNESRKNQVEKWNSFVYCDGYYYQGWEKIGINGIKPTEKRIDNYQITEYLDKSKIALDIGANCGFLACYIASFVKAIDAIELNPYLVKMGEDTKDYLQINNVHFLNDDFIIWEPKRKYDVVFSLSNHFTIDGNLNVSFEFYISKIFELMRPYGILLFESHNIWGDDKDIDLKFKIAAKYFQLKKHKMVRAFYPADIDKLFVVFERREKLKENADSSFRIIEAQHKYSYS